MSEELTFFQARSWILRESAPHAIVEASKLGGGRERKSALPGRITEELRRITRQQQGGSAPPVGPVAAPRALSPGFFTVLIVALLLAGAGFFVAQRLMEMSRLQDCMMAGRRNCAPVERDSTGNATILPPK